MSEFEGTFRTSKSYHLFSFPDRETGIVLYQIHKDLLLKIKSSEGKRLIQCHTAIQGQIWGQNSLILIQVLGLSTYPIRGRHSSPLGQGGVRMGVGGISLELWLFLVSQSRIPAEL